MRSRGGKDDWYGEVKKMIDLERRELGERDDWYGDMRGERDDWYGDMRGERDEWYGEMIETCWRVVEEM